MDRYLAEGGADWQVDPEDIRLLLELFDRGGFTDGYYTRHNSASMVFTGKKPERRIADEELRRQLEEKYIQSELQEKIKGKVRIQEGMPVTITVSAGACSVSLQGEEAGEAKSRPLTEADVRKQFSKTGRLRLSVGGACNRAGRQCIRSGRRHEPPAPGGPGKIDKEASV